MLKSQWMREEWGREEQVDTWDTVSLSVRKGVGKKETHIPNPWNPLPLLQLRPPSEDDETEIEMNSVCVCVCVCVCVHDDTIFFLKNPSDARYGRIISFVCVCLWWAYTETFPRARRLLFSTFRTTPTRLPCIYLLHMSIRIHIRTHIHHTNIQTYLNARKHRPTQKYFMDALRYRVSPPSKKIQKKTHGTSTVNSISDAFEVRQVAVSLRHGQTSWNNDSSPNKLSWMLVPLPGSKKILQTQKKKTHWCSSRLKTPSDKNR